MNSVALKITAVFAVMGFMTAGSCKKKPRPHVIPAPPKTEAVNISKAKANVTSAKGHSVQARVSVDIAQAEIKKARERIREIDVLISDLQQTNPSYALRLVELKQKVIEHINVLETELRKTGGVLSAQLEALRLAELELVKAQQQSIASENEKLALREANKRLNETIANVEADLANAQADIKKANEETNKYRDKYHKLTKYRWIVWGLGAWILVKFLGGLGAWSPQGRIARALIG